MRTGTATRNSRGSSVVPRPRARRAPTRPSRCWLRGCPADVGTATPGGNSHRGGQGTLTSALCAQGDGLAQSGRPVAVARQLVVALLRAGGVLGPWHMPALAGGRGG